jgi:hypothetical protein
VSNRCFVCWNDNDDAAEICEHCGAKLDKKVDQSKSVQSESSKQNGIRMNHQSLDSKGPKNHYSYQQGSSRIDSLEIVIQIIFGILLFTGSIMSVIFLIEDGFMSMIFFALPGFIGMFIYYFLSMALVEHMQNGKASRRELEQIKELLEKQQKSVD